MHISSSQFGTASMRYSGIEVAPALPSWVAQVIGPSENSNNGRYDIQLGTHFALLSLTHRCASELAAPEFRAVSANLYQQARDILSRPGIPPHLVRIWNFIPAIHDAMGDDLDRYRVFNQGRFDACADWFSPEKFGKTLPTATGIGHRGTDLELHFLTCTRPGMPVENPRQCPAFEYSTKLGPRPPCFARATLVDRLLIIGGTASVRGEDSVHLGSLPGQLSETFLNLSSLLSAANAAAHHTLRPYVISHARVYAPGLNAGRLPRESQDAIARYFGPDCEIEYTRGDICRSELLVEIEAIAQSSRSHDRT